MKKHVIMEDVDKPHSKFQQVYAVLRIDFPVGQENPENSIAIVKVLCSRTMAEQEVSRLSETNKAKTCRYVMHVTRLVP
jgi:hypothetical protein